MVTEVRFIETNVGTDCNVQQVVEKIERNVTRYVIPSPIWTWQERRASLFLMFKSENNMEIPARRDDSLTEE